MKSVWIVTLVTCACVLSTQAKADLILNGNFSGGNTGFTSGYPYNSSDLPDGVAYTVDSNSSHFNEYAGNYFDHTTGTGLMLLVDGATSPGVTAWQQTVTVSPNTTYTWTAFAMSWGQPANRNGIDPSPATLLFSANGVQLGPTFAVIAQDGQWKKFTGTFDSGSSSTAVLKIVDSNTAYIGNDFALDDISVPEPSNLFVSGIPSMLVLMRRRRQPRF